MKILYISIANDSYATGGIICRKVNKLALTNSELQFSDYYIHLKENRIAKFFDTLFGYKCGLSKRHIKTIIKKINNEKNDIVFLDTSLYGKLAKSIIKKTTAKVITFFHNCEYEIYKQSITNKFISLPLLHSVYVNELYSLKYSSKCIFLTERDMNECRKRYRINSESYISPIALDNSYLYKRKNQFSKPQKLLFVGSYFFPNIHGLIWFVNNVLPFVDYELTIVGKGFEKDEFTKQLSDKSKITVKGFVENLDSEYEASDVVIQPVFEGSGMKTKTAECFMYGKPLISTSEGLVGYIDGLKYVYRCDTKEEFIDVLNVLKESTLPSFCENLRKVFEEYYSLDSRIKNYRKILKEMVNE